jgi:hypothetical protein
MSPRAIKSSAQSNTGRNRQNFPPNQFRKTPPMYVTHTVHLLPKALDTKSIFSPSIFLNLRNNVKALSLPLSLSRLSTAAVAQEKGAAAAFHHQPSSSQTDEKKSDDGFYKVTSGQINQTWKEQNLLEVTFVGKELRSSFAKQLIILLRQIAK